jgi:hypothetical protein
MQPKHYTCVMPAHGVFAHGPRIRKTPSTKERTT